MRIFGIYFCKAFRFGRGCPARVPFVFRAALPEGSYKTVPFALMQRACRAAPRSFTGAALGKRFLTGA